MTYSEGAALLFVIRAVLGFAGFSCHSVFVPPAGDVLQQQQQQQTHINNKAEDKDAFDSSGWVLEINKRQKEVETETFPTKTEEPTTRNLFFFLLLKIN